MSTWNSQGISGCSCELRAVTSAAHSSAPSSEWKKRRCSVDLDERVAGRVPRRGEGAQRPGLAHAQAQGAEVRRARRRGRGGRGQLAQVTLLALGQPGQQAQRGLVGHRIQPLELHARGAEQRGLEAP